MANKTSTHSDPAPAGIVGADPAGLAAADAPRCAAATA
jgi:hypothetical protein